MHVQQAFELAQRVQQAILQFPEMTQTRLATQIGCCVKVVRDNQKRLRAQGLWSPVARKKPEPESAAQASKIPTTQQIVTAIRELTERHTACTISNIYHNLNSRGTRAGLVEKLNELAGDGVIELTRDPDNHEKIAHLIRDLGCPVTATDAWGRFYGLGRYPDWPRRRRFVDDSNAAKPEMPFRMLPPATHYRRAG